MKRRASLNLSGLATFAGALLLATACGGDGKSPFSQKEKAGSNDQVNPDKTTDVKLSLVSNDSVFALAAPTTPDYVIDISDCSSGYTTTVTSTTAAPEPNVPLYTGDGGCVAGLTSFIWAGVTYTKQGGGNLTTGSSLFVDGGVLELYVTVGTPLAATIGPGSEAIFLISEVKAGADYAISGYSTSADLALAVLEAPELEIPANGITLSSIDAGTGVATFAVNVQCANILSPSASSCRTPGSSDQPFSSMKAKLISDSFAGVLTYSDANAEMAAGATTVTDPGDLSTSAPITKEGFVLSLAGEGQLYSNKNMILLIEYTDAGNGAKSYRYFNVDIGDPQ